MDMLEQYCMEDDNFLRDILLEEPIALSDAKNEGPSLVNKNNTTTTTTLSVAGATAPTIATTGKRLRPWSPRTCMISFDKSTTLPAMPPEPRHLQQQQQRSRSSKSSYSYLSPEKRKLENLNMEPKSVTEAQGEKRSRSNSQNVNHVMLERIRRRELTHKFIALSATIPHLTKTDKTTIVRETIDYIKRLQKRVMELEQRNRRGKEPMTLNNEHDGFTTTSNDEMNVDDDCGKTSELLPEVKAIVSENAILIEIICERKNGIELKILDLLQNLHLFVTASTALPFGNSAVSITIIAQMGMTYRITTAENVRQLLLNDIHHLTSCPDTQICVW